jgi:magnesium transporter
MITYWQQRDGQFVRVNKNQIDDSVPVWVDARKLTTIDTALLEAGCGIDYDHITDILDPDELSRIEDGDTYVLTIVRIPVYEANAEVPYYTIPLGIILQENTIITICSSNNEVLEDISSGHVKGIILADFPAFIISLLSRADFTFLKYLKEINRQSSTIQRDLQGSIENKEIIKMLNLQKSLEYFTTSLSSNQLFLSKLRKTKLMTFDEDDNDWLDDIEIDNRQAMGMADTYSNILTSLMDTFTSVISNNLNIIMKKLTVINLVLMVPTFITSFFGMNIPLPFAHNGWIGMLVISGVCLLTTIVTAYMLRDRSPVKKLSQKRKSK